jgi:hypothetical protein
MQSEKLPPISKRPIQMTLLKSAREGNLRNIGYRQKCKNAAVSFLPEISAMLVVETHA